MFTHQFNLIFILFFLVSFSSCKSEEVTEPDTTTGKTIVEHFGHIHTKGNQIVDKNENPVALHGMSLFWSQWGGKYYNENVVKWLHDDWKCTIVRAACGVEGGGYLENSQTEMDKITRVIDACIKYGIYVIVDWHDHKAEEHLEQSKEFFKAIAQKYGDKENIIYEVYNEPLQVSWSNVVKPYAEEVIKVIRQYDPDNLIVVGNPTWSQDVDIAAKDPINDNNLAYVLHFYSSTHLQNLRDKATTALSSGVPLFVTEYGISEANGNGEINYPETDRWLKFVKENNLSSCNWSIIDKNETSAALKPGANSQGNWTDNELTVSGKYIKEFIRALNNDIFQQLENVQ